MAKYAYVRLQETARKDVERDFGRSGKTPSAESPIEIMANCSIFLAAVATISKILNRKPDDNLQEIKHYLGVGDVPHHLTRNEFEHIDQRLSLLYQQNPSASLTNYHLTRKNPSMPLVLKRFNPNDLTISYIDKVLSMKEWILVVESIERALDEKHEHIRANGFI